MSTIAYHLNKLSALESLTRFGRCEIIWVDAEDWENSSQPDYKRNRKSDDWSQPRYGYVPVLLVNDASHDTTGHGESVYESNYRWFFQNCDEHDVRETGGWGSSVIMLWLGESESAAFLADILEHLEDYPVIDESLISEVEVEWTEECINNATCYDLVNAMPIDVELDADDATKYIFEWMEESQIWPELEGEDVIFCNDDWDKLVEYAAKKAQES